MHRIFCHKYYFDYWYWDRQPVSTLKSAKTSYLTFEKCLATLSNIFMALHCRIFFDHVITSSVIWKKQDSYFLKFRAKVIITLLEVIDRLHCDLLCDSIEKLVRINPWVVKFVVKFFFFLYDVTVDCGNIPLWSKTY